MKESDIDQTIKEALSAEDAEWFEDMEPSVQELVVDVFQGKSRWLAAWGFFVMLTFLVLAVIAAFRFFQAESTREMIAWATGFLFCASTISMLKIWYWMEMNKNAVTREIKRFELQLARVSGKQED